MMSGSLSSPTKARRSAGWLSWARRLFVLFAGALAVCAGLAGFILGHLDRPWAKQRVQALVRSAAGVQVDYEGVHVRPLVGLDIDGLSIASPEEQRVVAPKLLTVRHISVAWSLRALLGPAHRVERLSVSHVSLTVVVDEQGRTSFDALPQSDAPPTPPTPLSKRAGELFSRPLPIAEIGIAHVELQLLQTEKGAVAQRVVVGGLGATVNIARSQIDATLGSAAEPLTLLVARTIGSTEARARGAVWLTASLTSQTFKTALDVKVLEQSFAPTLSAAEWLHAEAQGTFEPERGRTVITIDALSAADGALLATGAVEVPDAGDAIVRHADLKANVARILKWLPSGLVPVTADRAEAHVVLDALVASAVPHLLDGGSAAIDADVTNVGIDLAGGPVRVRDAKVTFRAEPGALGVMAGKGTAHFGATRIVSAGKSVAADGLDASLDGQSAADGSLEGHASLRFSWLEASAGASFAARGGHLDVHAKGVRLDATGPVATRGDVSLSSELASFEARAAQAVVLGEGVSVRTHAVLTGKPPYAAEIDGAMTRLRVNDADGHVFADASAGLTCEVRDLILDVANPAAIRGSVRGNVHLGETTATLDVQKGTNELDYTLAATAPSLRVVRPLLPTGLAADVPWDRVGATLSSTGHVGPLRGAVAIKHTTKVALDRPAFRGVSAQSIAFTARSSGTALTHEGDLDFSAKALSFAGEAPSDEHLTLSGDVDRERRAVGIVLGLDGRTSAKLAAKASFDAATHAIAYDIHGDLAKLAKLAPMLGRVHGLEGIDFSQLAVGISSRGSLLGVVADVAKDGTVTLEPRPIGTAAIEGKAELRLFGVRWMQGDTSIVTPSAIWTGELRAVGTKRTVQGHLEAVAFHLGLGSKSVDLAELRDDSNVTVTGDLDEPGLEVVQNSKIRAVEQDIVPGYQMGDLSLSLKADREHDGIIHVSELTLTNALGGTTAHLSGNLEVTGLRRMLSLTATVGQDLAHLSRTPSRFRGKGALTFEASVTSPDLSLFRVRAAMKASDVSFAMPREGIVIDTANGDVPIAVSVAIDRNGIALRPDEKRAAYSMLRFADQHPLFSRSGFLSIASLTTPYATIAPLVGNLEIERNIISLRQFELGLRGGTVTGQFAVDWDGPRSSVELHVRASGVQSSHGEPFDGNIAIVASAADRTIEGRADILRIGKRHLLDLLDLADPARVDPGMNRVRSGLALGYPDSMRVAFDHGFASVRLELGGLASVIKLPELRGIPMGPILDKMLAAPDATKETP